MQIQPWSDFFFNVHGSVHRESMLITVKQDATMYSSLYFCKLLYMFRVVTPAIIRSTYNCNYSIWHWSDRLCSLPLSWRIWNWKFQLLHDTCFRWVLRPSSGAHVTVITASGTGQTVSASFHYRGEAGTGISNFSTIHVSGGYPPIIRSTYNCNYGIWHWSNRLCYLPLSWRILNWKFQLLHHSEM